MFFANFVINVLLIGENMPGFEIFGVEERKEVNDVLDTGVLFRYGFDSARNGNWKARTFEKEFAEYLSIEHCLLVSSGTSALTTALTAVGVGVGDEVIVPPFTFVATVEAVIACGAIPVFADIDDTLCLNAVAIKEKITPQTKAIIVVQMCGSMAYMNEITEVCKNNNLLLMEDACQATGAEYNGKKIGTFGDIACFSFDSVKTITCGEGGGIVTNNLDYYKKADAFSDHGHDHIGNDRGKEGHEFIGLNFRISELNAAVGVAQLRKIDRILELQRKNKSVLENVLKQFDFIKLRALPDENGDSATFLSFFMPDEEKANNLANDLSAAGFDGVFYWYNNNWHYIRKWEHIRNWKTANKITQHFYDGKPDYNNLNLTKSDEIISRLLSIQIKIGWDESELNRRCEILKSVLSKY